MVWALLILPTTIHAIPTPYCLYLPSIQASTLPYPFTKKPEANNSLYKRMCINFRGIIIANKQTNKQKSWILNTKITFPEFQCFHQQVCVYVHTYIHITEYVCILRTACQVASVVSDSVRPHGLQPTRLLHPWDSPGKNTGVGCHFLLHITYTHIYIHT